MLTKKTCLTKKKKKSILRTRKLRKEKKKYVYQCFMNVISPVFAVACDTGSLGRCQRLDQAGFQILMRSPMPIVLRAEM